MKFILKMAWRDSRASRGRLGLVSLSIVLGIAALVGIASIGDNLRRTVELQTRTLLGADLTITDRRDFSPALLAYVTGLGGEVAQEFSLRSMITIPGRGNQRRLVQIRALTGNFPFYGELVTEPTGAMQQVRDNGKALLEETIMVQFGLAPGDEVRIGQATLQVAGALKKIPGESASVALFSPRVYVSLASLKAAGLFGRDTFATHRLQVKLPPGRTAEAVVQEMRERFRGEQLHYSTIEERKRDLGQNLKNVYSFLSLVGFVALFLGAVGVASAMHVYIRQKIATVAVLRCLGASARTSFMIYLVQAAGIGVLGAIAGGVLGLSVQRLLPAVLKDFLPFPVELFISWPAVGRGCAAGLAICIVFALLPLLAVRRVSPLLAIRAAQGENTQPDPWRRGVYALIAAAVAGFAVIQAGSWRVGAGFSLMLAAAFALLAAVAWLAIHTARRLGRRSLPYVWRQGLANLHRPNNRTLLLLLSLGLGVFLMLTLVLTRGALLAKISGIGGGDRPDLVLFDVQEDQLAALEAIARKNGTPLLSEAPMVMMRLSRLRGHPVEDLLKDDRGKLPGWALRREYRSTYRSGLSATERLVAGTFIGHISAGATRAPVSIEEGLAKDLHLELGDELTFDVQGVTVECVVASLRQVEWQRMQPNFFVVFPTGLLETAPKTFIAATRTGSAAASARLQQALARELPNVSAIDLSLILETLDGIFSKAAFVISFLAGFTVITGLIVLMGAVLSGRHQRIRETVLLRTLGATRRQLRQIQLVEYGALGVLAAVTGGVLALVSNALLARFVFKAPVVAEPVMLLAAGIGAVVVTVAAGLLANRGVTTHPPLEVLRQEG